MRLAWRLAALGAAALAALTQSTMAAPDMAAAMKTLDQAMDVVIPEDAKKYIKQGRIMLAMFTGKLKTDKCKKAYDAMYKTVEDMAEKPGKLTGRKLVSPFCAIGDHCVSEAVEVVTSMASSSEIIKNGINNYLKKQGMDLDTVVAGAPLFYMGICATYNSIEEQEKTEL